MKTTKTGSHVTKSKPIKQKSSAPAKSARKRLIEKRPATDKQLLQALLENVPEYIYYKDLKSRFLKISDAHARVFGLKNPDEAVGKTDFDFFTEEHARKAFEDEQEIIRTGQSISREEKETWPDRPPTWVLTTKMPFRDDAGKIIGTVGISKDITLQKRAEEKFAEERNLLRTLIDNLPDRIFVKDTEGRKTISNLADWRASGGKTMEDVIGKTDFDTYPAKLAAEFWAIDKAVLNTGIPIINHEERGLNAEGNEIWVLSTKVPLRDGNGKAKGLVGIGHDITERKRTELELLRQKQFLEALNLNSPVAIVVQDNQGKIISSNPAFEKLYGYTPNEIIGKDLDTLITTPETLNEARAYTAKTMSGHVHGFGKRLRKDGSTVIVEILGDPVFVAGEKVGSLAIYHDITELDEARKQAEEANQAKSEFLANMSHEIRTPMNGVIGMLELALDTTLTLEQQDYLQTSLQSAEALLVLLNDILDLSKMEAGKLQLESINFNLRNMVEDIGYTLAKRAQDKGLELACLIHPDLTSDLRGDPGRLRQIFVNLVGNAIKFTHQGEIVLRAEPIKQTDHDATIRFSVQDTGIGIPYERQAAIFERFTQADGSVTRKYGGSGLGLTISKQLVEALGGTIGLESKPGAGSTFWFIINFEKQLGEKRGTAPLHLDAVALRKTRVLGVDDNRTNRTVLTRMVEGFGSRIDVIGSGSKALEMLHSAQRAGDPYQVVLLDMQMPGIDGEQTARAIKSDPVLKDLKIIILTSIGQRGDAARLEAMGCSAYLLKPVKQRMLYGTLVAVLGRDEVAQPGIVTRHVLTEQMRFGLRVLLAEDNEINEKLAVMLLQKAGYSVDAVENGAQAVQKVKTEKYNAVLMDVQMPEMDGFEATRLIRAWEEPKNIHIPILAMTAHAMIGDREKCLEAGMDDYISKPLEPRLLFHALDRWIPGTELLADKAETAEETQDYLSNPISSTLPTEAGLTGEESEPMGELPKRAAHESMPFISSSILPIDFEGALHRFGNDRGFMMKMCKEYAGGLPDRLTEINLALAANDANKLGRLAHNLKGVSLNFNAEPLANIARQLEELGKLEDLTEAPRLVQELEMAVHSFEEYLGRLTL